MKMAIIFFGNGGEFYTRGRDSQTVPWRLKRAEVSLPGVVTARLFPGGWGRAEVSLPGVVTSRQSPGG